MKALSPGFRDRVGCHPETLIQHLVLTHSGITDPDTIVVEEADFWKVIATDEESDINFSGKVNNLRKEFQLLCHIFGKIVEGRISDLIVKEKTSVSISVKEIFIFKKTFGLVISHLLACCGIPLKELVIMHPSKRMYVTKVEKKEIEAERKKIEKEQSKSEGEQQAKGVKRRAVVSPKQKKQAKRGKKATPPTLLKDSET
ncbi:hypothetical protein Dimus_036432, partial [Dionaea muscipula]